MSAPGAIRLGRDNRPILQDPAPGVIQIAHLTTAHRADDIRVFWKECLSLAAAGYGVTLIVPDKGGRRMAGPGGEVAIIPVKLRPGRLGRIMLTPLSVFAASLRCRAAVYHFHDPPFLPYALILRVLGRRVIYDVHEDLPRDIEGKSWIPSVLRPAMSRAAGGLEWLAGRLLSGIVAAWPAIARRFPRERTALAQNFATLTDRAPVVPWQSRPPALVYIGSISCERGAAEMVAVLQHLPAVPGLRLILAGSMHPASLETELTSHPAWGRVEYRGWQDRSGVRRTLSEARIGLMLFHPLPNHMHSGPNKLFEYLAAGLPVIASDFPSYREVVEVNRCGICVPPQDVTALSAAITWMFEHPQEAEDMGRRGQELVERTFNWGAEVPALLRLYDRVLGRQPAT